jgi:hypothetical protein
MSNTQRPSLQRKHTRTTKQAQQDQLNVGYRMTIDGEVYEARLGEVTPEIARELRRSIGVGFMGLMEQMHRDADIDLVSAAVWVARRIRGERVALEDAVVSYADMLADGFDIGDPGSGDAADDPEA